jgi:hypothetical protein
MPDLAGQDFVGGQPDGAAESLRLKILMDGGINGEPFGVVRVLVSCDPAEHRLSQL